MILLKRHSNLFCWLLVALVTGQCTSPVPPKLDITDKAHIALIGGNLGSRMMNYGYFETELHTRFPDHSLFIRNMCDGGDTPGFRAHSGRNDPWAFPGAEQFQTELAQKPSSEGHLETPDQWLTKLQTDIIIAFFGYSESFEGEAGLERFKQELEAFIHHTQDQRYNGTSSPQLALVSPIAFQDLSQHYDLPNGQIENQNLALYSQAMNQVAQKFGVPFIDMFQPSSEWFSSSEEMLTIDGVQLNQAGYAKFSELLADELVGKKGAGPSAPQEVIQEAVLEKNWFWHNYFKIPNGVHVFGRRYNPFGPDNYPAELKKIREMIAVRDTAIWQACHNEIMDLEAADSKTFVLPPVETNFELNNSDGVAKYLYGDDALKTFKLAPGYNIELFASEQEFADLANPVQLSFDNQGRLWVATMPGYPHYRPGDPRPNDKIIILEDTDGDGKADKQTTFLDGLHLPTGFEITSEGVFVSQGTNLMLYTDTDGDDKADKSEVILSGFDDHDTHHVISAFCADPSGAIYMGEGVFLHTNVETPYGTIRATNGGFYRYNPQRRQLERTAQIAIPNPWGIAFDEWGQNMFLETSGPDVRWMMPSTIKPKYGIFSPKSTTLVEEKHLVRPTSGLEFISSSHFPEAVQGDFILNNAIGFLGTKQHRIEDEGTGYKTRHRQDLLQSSDQNFRPVDMEFAPDGSLYLVDWHNVLVGHMQHNARDPLRDHVHGRIYRITYPARPLVVPPEIYGAPIPQLLDNLKLPEYRARYRTRRELRGRDKNEVLVALSKWLTTLDPSDPRYEHHQLEGLWVSWGSNQLDQGLLSKLLSAKDFRARAGAIRVLRYMGHQVENASELLKQAADDEAGRVRLEAVVAASWLPPEQGLAVLAVANKHAVDPWMKDSYESVLANLSGQASTQVEEEKLVTDLTGKDLDLFLKGKEIYSQDGYCSTCHQPNGQGLLASGFPPLAGTNWVLGNKDRLIKLTLNGLVGPLQVMEQEYSGQVPMTPFRGLLNDEETAAVLTFVRNSFGNKADAVYPEEVLAIRLETKDRTGFYTSEELLAEHPWEVDF